MYKIVFFCIPAHGHTNPTLEAVRELTERGNKVRYYSYEKFRDKIEAVGAEFIACDSYDVQMNLQPEDAAKVGRDMAFSIRLLTETTLALDEMVCGSLREFSPDCVVSDSMAVWGKFAANKLGLPFVSSTTTFAFNRYSAKVMNQSMSQVFAMAKALPGMNKEIKKLKAKGYPVKNVLSLISNDNDTDTIVYTSKGFQPCAETFSDRYVFVGPSLPTTIRKVKRPGRKRIFISMGTVNTHMPDFYRNCILALENSSWEVVMSVGEGTDIEAFGKIPENISIYGRVDQPEVLSGTDVFLTHCGMNSVSEGLYFGVPLVMFPQTAEQGGVAKRVAQLGAGVYLKENSAGAIAEALDTVLSDVSYTNHAEKIASGLQEAGGAPAAAEAIIKKIKNTCM